MTGAFTACGGEPSGECVSAAGRWGVSGTCGEDLCEVTQIRCDTMFRCGGGSRASTGVVSGSSASWSGQSPSGQAGQCSAQLTGDRLEGECRVAGLTCTVIGQRLGDPPPSDAGPAPGRDAGTMTMPDSGSEPACADIAGTWSVGGECGPDVCVVAQTGCATSFRCSGSRASTGTVTETGATWTGEVLEDVDGTCTAAVSGGTMTGTCSALGVSCAFTALRQ